MQREKLFARNLVLHTMNGCLSSSLICIRIKAMLT